ncbi:esterase/lipase family protein [Streptomyces sp. NPDC057877]|uniref:esterase/lipase family protein n=1 Tax=Streptomyces sp. NPDC057877 TaxID=3346269 RepID=UPI0036B3B75E
MPIRDRATSVLAALRDGHDIGSRPFILVGHSLGGLVIKQIVRHSDTMGDQFSGFADHLAGVVFFSTPHTGSGLATLLSYLKAVRSTPLVRELATDQAYLRELDDWYRNYAARRGLAHLSFYETQDTKGLRVVGESSGDPHLPGSTAIPVDADHRTVCKFSDSSDVTYAQVRRFLVRRVEETAPPVVVAPVRSTRGDEWTDADAVADKVLLGLLSEQLPSGGWARSLARWMTAYASASEMQAPARPPMRLHGGIDVTCAALNGLVSTSDGSTERLRTALQESLWAGTNFLRERTSSGGAVGATIQTRTAPTEVRIRHTAITLATLLRLQRGFGETRPYPEVVRSAKYLVEHLGHWRLDTSGTFGMMAGAWALYEFLTNEDRILGPHLSEDLQNTLATTVDEMAQEVEKRVSAASAGTSTHSACARFGAYGNMSALAQSSFLFSAKQVTSLQLGRRSLGLAQRYMHEQIIATCQRIALAVVEGDVSRDGLLTVPTPNGPQPDIGLSVQALSVFDDLRVADHADDTTAMASSILRLGLDRAFRSTDEVDIQAKLKYTHGVQFVGLLQDPAVANALRTDRALYLTVARTSRRTLSQRDIVAVQNGGVWARAWSRTLENGYFVQQEVSPAVTTAWRPQRSTVEAVLRLLPANTESRILWFTGEAEAAVGLVPVPRPNLVRSDFPERTESACPATRGGADLVYLPTAATSSTIRALRSALSFARNRMADANSQAVLCIRFGDHRLTSESNEGILFLENSAQLERLLHDCRLRLLGIDNTGESLDGTESVIRFSATT